MVIRKQPVISWLLDSNKRDYYWHRVGIAATQNLEHYEYLSQGFNFLAKIQTLNPNWGLPELVMPSFEDMMSKIAKSFFKIDNQLFQEFSKTEECGILISKYWGTIIYGFGDNILYVWLFATHSDGSKLYQCFYAKSTEKNTRLIYACPSLTENDELFVGDAQKREDMYECLTNFIVNYLAVKKYAPVETVIVPMGATKKLENAILEYNPKEKIKNISGQEVVVMDSRWFRRIVYEEKILVNGYLRLQNKKNAEGAWYKELIYVSPYSRRYDRGGTIENAVFEDDMER